MKRRSAWIAGVAGAAAVAGVGLGLWRRHAAAGDPAVWSLQFETPQGGQLALSGYRGRPLLLNFWATWCPPCVGEMPLLDRFHRERQAAGWQVVGLAVDNRDPVLAFLRERPVSYAIGLAGMGGVQLSRTMGNSSGALPFSLVFGPGGELVERKLGVIDSADLTRWAATLR